MLPLCAAPLASESAACDLASKVFRDPHINFAYGGSADLRGRPNALYNFLSAPGLSVSVKTEEAVFKIHDGASKRTPPPLTCSRSLPIPKGALQPSALSCTHTCQRLLSACRPTPCARGNSRYRQLCRQRRRSPPRRHTSPLFGLQELRTDSD